MKFEWKKIEKEVYLPKEKPMLIEIPKYKFIMIKGFGNPNNEDFSKRVEALYSLAYTIKMMPKKGINIDGYFDYTVYPLEGIWDLSEEGRKQEKLNKDELVYTIMIRQPDFVTQEVFDKAKELARKKSDLVEEVIFDTIEDGLSVQMLHVGSYDDEPRTFDIMKQFIKDNNLELRQL
jgi:hypothetical protein